MPPSPSFEKLCKDQHIPVPPKLDSTAYLTNAAVPPPSPATAAAINECCATLAWARHSVTSQVDPDTWPTLVDASLSPRLLALYALPLLMDPSQTSPTLPGLSHFTCLMTPLHPTCPRHLRNPNNPSRPCSNLPCPSHSLHFHCRRPAPGNPSAPSGLPSCTPPAPLASSFSSLPIRLLRSRSHLPPCASHG